MKAFYLVLSIVLLVFTNSHKAFAQKNYSTEDSLKGFDASEFLFGAKQEGVKEEVIEKILIAKKRNFINEKYGIKPINLVHQNKTLSSVASALNEDFEDAVNNPGPQVGGNVNGWSFFGGSGAYFCSTNTAVNTAFNYTVYNAPYVDLNIAFTSAASITASYFDASSNIQPSGSCFLRLNDAGAGAKVIRISKTYTISTANSLFQYAYKLVLNDPAGHTCCDMPGFKITATITNTATNTSTVLSCPQISVALGASCGTLVTVPSYSVGSGGYNFTNWVPSSIDLSNYIGFAVTIDVIAIDCSFGGHAGYAYFDAKCSSASILSNGNPITINSGTTIIPTCGSTFVNLSAPPNSGPYSWASNSIFIPFSLGIPSNTNTSFSTPQTGTLQLSYYPNGANCGLSAKTLSIVANSALSTSLTIQPNCSNSITAVSITNSPTALINYSWQPPPSSLSVNSATAYYTSNLNGSVTVQDVFGCIGTSTFSVNPITNPLIANGALITPTCSINTINLIPTISTSFNNTIIYYSSIPNGAVLNPPSATVLPGVNTPSLIVSSNAIPGNYYFTVTNTLTTCQASHSFVVTNCLPLALNSVDAEPNLNYVYPNPSKGTVVVKLDGLSTELLSLSIFDVQGKMLLRQSVTQDEKLTLNLQSGLYFYQFDWKDKKSEWNKLLINND